VEYFYDELQPYVHYVPASLDNLTQVAEYVLDKKNENEMQNITRSANAWCQRKMTSRRMAKDMLQQLKKYETELKVYMKQHNINQTEFMESIEDADLVNCNVTM